MYNSPGSDTDREWVELYNTENNPVTVIGGSTSGAWRINDGTNHLLSATPAQGNMAIPSGGFVIIAKNASVFLSDYPSFSGTVIQSSISLNNTGATVGLRIDSNGVFFDEFSYQNTLGAAGDGNSLQRKSDGNWIAAFPTPGSQNTNNPPPSLTPTPTPSLTPAPTPTRVPSSSPTAASKKSTNSTTTSASPSPGILTPQSFVEAGPNSSKTPSVSNKLTYRIASVAAATTSAAPMGKVEVKNEKQTNPFVWIGLIFIFAGIGTVGYIYLIKNAKIHIPFSR